ncbi:hypothetical protein ACW14Y_40720 [Kitasatospora sp. cg17-2]
MGEWFDPDGADVVTCRQAFTLLWQALRRHWDDAVLMGSPSQTGRDLWSRTIPTSGKWAGGYPVLSEELRALLHATGGQGRTELLLPPRVPERLPALVEYDRTFAYAKHLWKSPVGTPRRITAAAFAAMTEAEQTKALMSCSHWNVRVTVPAGWNHVGLLPAPVTGDRAWIYPATPGTTFTTWAGGAEVHLALSNHLAPWRIEVLGGLLFEDSKPLDEWGKRLKAAWADLTNLSKLHGDERQRTAAYLASRAVRSVLLFGLGGFAQRPRLVSGTTPLGETLPAGVEILGQDDQVVTWQRQAGFSRDPYAHPEWAAYVWSGARAALLDMKYRQGKEVIGYAGALHAKPGTVVYFGTDGIALTERQPWPYRGEPGDYLLKGHLTGRWSTRSARSSTSSCEAWAAPNSPPPRRELASEPGRPEQPERGRPVDPGVAGPGLHQAPGRQAAGQGRQPGLAVLHQGQGRQHGRRAAPGGPCGARRRA